MSKSTSYKKKSKVNAETPTLLLYPLMAVLAIVPLIVRLYVYDCGLTAYDFYESTEQYYSHNGSADLFLFWKMVIFCVFSGIMLMIVGIKLAIEKKQIKFSKMFIPLGVYALLALLSSLLSEYRHFSFTGIYEQFESLWALLGYCLVAYYAFLYINSVRDMKYVLWALIFSTVILIGIGISQAFFTDFYKTKFAQALIAPGAGELTFNFEPGRVYMSLYNPNYVGSYVALLMPLFLMLVFGADKLWKKICSGAIVVLLIVCLMASQSRAGFVGLIASVVLMPVVFNKKLIKNWIPVLISGVLILGVIIGYDKYSNGYILNRFKSSFHPSSKEFNLTSIKTLDDEIVFTYKGNDLHAVPVYDPTDGAITVDLKDGQGLEVITVNDDNHTAFVLQDERFPGFRITPVMITESQIGFEFRIDGQAWNFARRRNTYYLVSPYGKFVKTEDTEGIDWMVHTVNFASGRGYIWGKTIPLLKHYFVLGSGADTFVLAFPNHDFLSMYNGGFFGQTITKPHNMYLQMGVQTGVLSVIAFLVFYFWFFFYGMTTCFRIKKYDFMSFVGAGILTGTAGYMVVQLINDSSITVAPIYWTLMGAGIAAFTYIRKTDNYIAKVPKTEKKAK